MAFGAITSQIKSGGQPSAPLRADRIVLVGDDDYKTGGTADTTAALNAAMTPTLTRTVIDVIGQDETGQYKLQFDGANDKLKIIDMNTSPPAEVSPGDKSGITFVATVFSK